MKQLYNKKGFFTSLNRITDCTNCTKLSRCNSYKKCKSCHTIYKNKQIKKLTYHLDEISIRKYKYKQYLIFSSLDTHKYENYKNADMENFINELIQTKRNKSSILKNSQYIAIKEISYTKQKGYNPHYNFIYLSDKKFIQSKAFKNLASRYNIKVSVKEIYKTERSFLKSIKKIINYSLKFDINRLDIERKYNTTKGQRDIKKSGLFIEQKFINLHKRLYKYISEINRHYNAKRLKALKLYKTYNKSKNSTKVRMLRSLNNKLIKIESSKIYYSKLLKKHFCNDYILSYKHLLKNN